MSLSTSPTPLERLDDIKTKIMKEISEGAAPFERTFGDYMDFFLTPKYTFNTLSRIILIATNIIIFEKFLESRIIKIKLQTVGRNKIRTKFLEIIYKEFWYLPFVMLFYNIIVIMIIYVLYFCFFLMVYSQNSRMSSMTTKQKSDSYLFNLKIFGEMIIIFFLSLIINLIILIVIYYILVVLSKERVSVRNDTDNTEITDKFIDKFYSYYRFSYYSSILFIAIFLQDFEYSNYKPK